ncbi:MAG: DUF4349 domain-containing protein [Defluviitaleaceae bacterium]|nr:DUF4349 domain-containing protein [Defluviitaleaceae bacterium]
MRLLIGLSVFLVCCVAFATNAYAATERFLIRTYRIDVAVECLESALPRILTMPGIDLHSEMNIQAGNGRMERVVENHELTTTLNILRGLGEVTATSSHARSEFAQFNGLQSEFRIRSEEERNLTALLLEAETLTDFRIIESRLVNLIAEIEMLRGRINHLNAELGTTRINITITTIPPEEEYEYKPEPEPAYESEEDEEGSLQRIGNAFLNSARVTLAFLQMMLLILAHVSVPLISLSIIGGGLVLFIRRKLSRKQKISKGGDVDETEKTHEE